jgi:DNA-binding LytR/AlgR family response regulator
VRVGEQIIPVEMSDVACFYSEDKANFLMTFDGHKYMIDITMDALVEELDPSCFFRVSRGCIVARKAVRSVTRQPGPRLSLSMQPKPPVEITVSRARVDDFLAWLE